MGFLELLTLIFVAMKLLEVVDWSWWVVFSPLYVYIVLIFALGVFGTIAGVREAIRKSKK